MVVGFSRNCSGGRRQVVVLSCDRSFAREERVYQSRLLAICAIASAGLVCPPEVWCQDLAQPEQVAAPTQTPETPNDKTIQKAVMRCLSSVDASGAALQRQGRFQGLSEEGEERYCLEQKRACQVDPGGFACRNFVRDYIK